MREILYEVLTPVRQHILKETNMNTLAFIKRWSKNGGIENSDTDEAKVLADFVKKQVKEDLKYPTNFQTCFGQYKAWLQMYAESCELAHAGYSDMTAQNNWDNLKKIEAEVNSGVAKFLNPEWEKHVLDAINDVRRSEFNLVNNQWEDKEGNPIVV
jgi:hypothetical protein